MHKSPPAESSWFYYHSDLDDKATSIAFSFLPSQTIFQCTWIVIVHLHASTFQKFSTINFNWPRWPTVIRTCTTRLDCLICLWTKSDGPWNHYQRNMYNTGHINWPSVVSKYGVKSTHHCSPIIRSQLINSLIQSNSAYLIACAFQKTNDHRLIFVVILVKVTVPTHTDR